MCSSSPLLNMVSMDAQSWAPPRGGRHVQEEEDGGIAKRCVSMEVLSSLWSGGEKSSRSYASTSSLAWPFSFLNLTPLPSSRTSSRGGGASLRAASSKPLSGSIIGLVVQEDANSASNLSNSSSAIASEVKPLAAALQHLNPVYYTLFIFCRTKMRLSQMCKIPRGCERELQNLCIPNCWPSTFYCRSVLWSVQWRLNVRDMMEFLIFEHNCWQIH